MFAAPGDFWKTLKVGAVPYLGLLALLILGVLLLNWVRKRFRDHEGHATDEMGMLARFRELQAQGDLTDEEFRSIKSRLIQSLDAPAHGNSPATKDEQRDSNTGGSNPGDAGA